MVSSTCEGLALLDTSPQAVRRVIPPLLNHFIGLQKDTALVGALGVVEAFHMTQTNQAATFNGTYYLVAATLEEGPPEQIFGAPREERTRQFLQRIIDAGRM